MASSLHELLTNEGFEGKKFLKGQKKVKFKDVESYTLPIYICHDRKSFDFSRPKTEKSFPRSGSSVYSSKRGDSVSRKSVTRRPDEPAIDEIAIRAVVSILSGYVGQYLRDKNFRETIREKCYSCLVRRKEEDSDNGIFANMELGIESIERLVEIPGTKSELKMKSLRNSIGFLTIVASLNSKTSKNGSTSGTPNSHLSACAQLYLSIVYKIEKNDRISARHLLQVFCDSPFLARTHLLPDLWEHFFLPHLLHLKIWYGNQVEILSNTNYKDKENKMEALSKVYDDQMDMGTNLFALYYKEWLKTGAQAPPLPTVPLPSRSSYAPPRRRRSSNSSINNFLYRAVFGPTVEHQRSTRSMDFAEHGNVIDEWGLEEEEEEEEKFCLDEYDTSSKRHNNVESRVGIHRRSMSQSSKQSKPDARKSDYMRFLPCRSEQTEYSIPSNNVTKNGSVKKIVNSRIIIPSNDLSKAVTTICTSDSLNDCEMAIRVMTKAWLDSKGDPIIENTLSKAPVIDGMLEVLFASNNDEVLELVISILAEFVTRKEKNMQIVLNLDPQLDTFRRLMRNSSLFLKAASLLHLVKPKAKQMISVEWVPLVLRVLEFGDQLQTLFTVQCSPQVAVYYFLDQLLTGFDEDKNLENARQVVSLGGLSLLVRRIKTGDIDEKGQAASVLCCCIRADGRCRHYLANNLSMDSILALLVLGKHTDYDHQTASASALLSELVCLHRVTQRTKFLNGFINGWGSLNTMHILLLYLRRARPEEQPIVAAVLLQLDLMGDPLKCSVFRDEAVEVIIAALDCQICNEKVQQQLAKALSILGGRFSYTGEPEAEKWLLKEAGFHEIVGSSFHGSDVSVDGFKHLNDNDEETENWQRKAAVALFNSGNAKLLAGLSDCIANGIPSLARASLITVSWMSTFLHSIGDENLRSVTCSILAPRLIECLNYDKSVEERVLASLSLLALAQCSDYISKEWKPEKGLLSHLQNLSRVTWTATKLTSIITSSPRRH